jgi:hypothetical protein
VGFVRRDIVRSVSAGWDAWWASIIMVVAGLLILLMILAVVLYRSTVTRRELARFVDDVRTSTARLQQEHRFQRAVPGPANSGDGLSPTVNARSRRNDRPGTGR